jgi:hypothetical protein
MSSSRELVSLLRQWKVPVTLDPYRGVKNSSIGEEQGESSITVIVSPSITLNGARSKKTVCFQWVHKLAGPVENETSTGLASFSLSAITLPFRVGLGPLSLAWALMPTPAPTRMTSAVIKFPSTSTRLGVASGGTSDPSGTNQASKYRRKEWTTPSLLATREKD